MLLGRRRHISSAIIIIFGFLGVILLGTLLLMLPFASKAPGCAPFGDALFTATSATCVTGLIVQDTATYWTLFGHIVIIILIQIGGLGVLTVAAAVAMISGRKIGLVQRSTMQDAISAPHVGGIVKLTRFILKGVFLFEGIGAVVLAPSFIRDYGPVRGIWYSLFHSISAFCNAGFDLMGINDKYSSMTRYVHQPFVIIPLVLLIIIGGIGFLTWEDVYNKKLNLRRYRLQSKIALAMCLILTLVPFIYFILAEFRVGSGGDRALEALFQTATLRTAGFNTVDFRAISSRGLAIMIPLMLIGGSPGSTAGGLKTTTIAVLCASAVSVFRRREDAVLFNRRIETDIVKNASAILMMYLILFFTAGLIISGIEDMPLIDCLFETGSAIGTVGITLGITPSLGRASQAIIICLMFFGRVGGLTVIFAALSGARRDAGRKVSEKVTVG